MNVENNQSTGANVFTTENNRPDWPGLLKEALEVPGRLSDAYRIFHNYSLGNRLLAIIQLIDRGLDLSPIASFGKWKELGRSVKKGQKAIAMVMPVTIKKKEKDPASGKETEAGSFNLFVLKRNWFSLDQTEGAEYVSEAKSPVWDKATALSNLKITQVKFSMLQGNIQGYASDRSVSVSPLAALPHKTLFHEMAHVLLGHTQIDAFLSDAPELPTSLVEAEAEATAYLCCATLGLPGLTESRAYIQRWLAGAEFPDKSAARVFKVADLILKSGVPTAA